VINAIKLGMIILRKDSISFLNKHIKVDADPGSFLNKLIKVNEESRSFLNKLISTFIRSTELAQFKGRDTSIELFGKCMGIVFGSLTLLARK
jgi:hypothetical protein